jgi:cobalt/nickel transport system permease protein
MSGRFKVEKNLAKFTSLLQESFFAEEAAKKNGWLQSVDPRVKFTGFIFLILCASFSRRLDAIAMIYAASLILAAGSRVFSLHLFRKVWLFIPLYTAIIAFPSIFITPGERMFGSEIPITLQGVKAASFLILRVATSVSFMLLLVLVTPWAKLLKALRSLFVPRLLVLMLLMTYRYIYLLLQIAGNIFLAKNSRRVGPDSWQSTGNWLGGTLGALMGKSIQTSQEVQNAMISRGFSGEPRVLEDFSLTWKDYVWATAFILFGLPALLLHP